MKKLLLALLFISTSAFATGEFYLHGGYPAQGAAGSSSAMRAELDLIQAGFDKLPTLAGNGSKIVEVNSGATGLDVVSSVLASQGGTGITSYAVGDVLYASGATTLSKLADVATGNALISGGVTTAPSWGKIGLTTHVSGILPTANGGTGIAYFTAAGPTVARVYTFPDAAATVLTSNAAVTVAQGGTGLATLTANNVILGNGTSAPTFVAPGTNGNALLSNGTTWTSSAVTSPALVLLATLTPTAAANVDALTTFSATYNNYLIIGNGITPATASNLNIRLAVAGSADAGTNYYSVTVATSTPTSTGATSLLMSTNNVLAAGVGLNFEIIIKNANDATYVKSISSGSSYQDSATPSYAMERRECTYAPANAVTGVRFYWTSGANFGATGKIRIYGYTNS